MQLIKVRYIFENENTVRESSREYIYFSEENLAVGDIVIVPVKDTTSKAKVTAINVPEAEIEHFRAAVKTIPAGAMVLPISAKDDIEGPEPENISQEIEPANVGFNQKEKDMLVLAGTDIIKTSTIFLTYKREADGMKQSALAVNIASDIDMKTVTNDCVLIAGLKKGIDNKRQEYVKPLNDRVKSINDAFRELSTPVDEADKILRDKMNKYNSLLEARRRMAEEVNKAAEDLARKQAELSGTGEITQDIAPVVVPEAPAAHVRAEMGTAGTIKTRKAKVIDFAKLPDTYKLPNDRLLATAAATGVKEIPGVEFYIEESIRITGRR